MKAAQRSLVICAVFVAFAAGAHQLLLRFQTSRAKRILAEKFAISENELSAESLNFSRGDVLVRWDRLSLRWTVNIPSHQIISWQSKKRESSGVRSSLQNF
jgi:hypothetical protein